MTTWISRSLIVPAEIIDRARNIGECLGPASTGMFTTPLSPTGVNPPTHYISSGLIEDIWLYILSNSDVLYQAAVQGASAQEKVLEASLEDISSLVSNTIISDKEVFSLLDELSLKLIN